jgi:hypothetical protein
MATGALAASKLPSNNANLPRITGIDKFLTLPSPNHSGKKKAHETPWALWQRPFSRRARSRCGIGG